MNAIVQQVSRFPPSGVNSTVRYSLCTASHGRSMSSYGDAGIGYSGKRRAIVLHVRSVSIVEPRTRCFGKPVDMTPSRVDFLCAPAPEADTTTGDEPCGSTTVSPPNSSNTTRRSQPSPHSPDPPARRVLKSCGRLQKEQHQTTERHYPSGFTGGVLTSRAHGWQNMGEIGRHHR
jgi:hypothetical protein